MDWLNRARQFVGNLFGGAQRTIGQISGGVARAVGQAEQQAARTAQQVARQIPQVPRIQLPRVPQVQMPRFQAPRVQLPQAPKIDLAAVSRALQAPSQAVQQTTRNVLGQAGRTFGDLQRQSDAIRQRQIQQTQADIARFRTSPATAIFQTQALSPFGGISQAFKGAKVGIGRELPKFDTTKAVEDVSKQLAKTPLRKIPGMGVVGDVVKPLALSAARMADVAQTQEEYAQGIKGIGQMGSDIVNIGSLFYAGGLSKQLATKGTAFLPTAARLAPRLAASGAGQNIIAQLAEGKKLNELNPKEIALAAGAYTALGIGIPAATKVGGAAIRKTIGAVTPTAQAAKVGQALPTDKNALVIAGSLPEKGALRAQGYTNVKVQFQPKPGQVAPTMQGAIPQVAPKAPKGQEALFAEARKYKSADDFVNAQGLKFEKEIENGEKRLVIDLFPNNYIKGKGITKSETLNAFNNAYISGNKIVEPSNGLWTKDGFRFIKSLEKDGYIKQIENRGGIERYKITSKINNIKTKSQLTDIYNQANKPTLPVKPIYETAPKPTVTPKGVEAPKSSVQTVIDALAEAKPIRGKQERLYSAERAKRAARVAAMGEKVQGEKGFFAQLGQLKGELPKAQFEGIRKQITQPVVDDLFNQIEKSNISVFEKVTAKQGLAKLLGAEGGVVPTRGELSLLNEVFPKELTQAILAKRTVMQKLGSIGGEIINLPRSIMSTVDLSAPFRQGIFMIGRPKQFIPAVGQMIKYAGSEKAYQGLQAQLRSRPTYQLMRQSKLALTDIDAPLLGREEAFMSNLAEKIPGFGILARGSDRAYTGFLNKLRADVFDDLLTKAKTTGAINDNPQIADDIANFVNAATGRGKLPNALEKSAVALNGIFFSPRLMASRLNLLNPVYYVKLDPFVRKEALKSLFTFAATGASVLGLAKAGGADVGVDPRSSDFGKIKIGNTRYDPWGGFQQYMVLASRLISGEMISSTTGKQMKLGESFKDPTRLDIIQRFLESKQAPIASFVTGFLKGKTTTGEDFNLPAEVVDRFMPMMTQDMYDLYKEYGTKGIAMGIPGIFGFGSQTYQDQIPVKTKTKSGKETTTWRQAPSLGEEILNKLTGKQITNVPQEQIAGLQEARKKEIQYGIDLDKVKAEVLASGETKTIHNPVRNVDIQVYLKDGIVTTKDIKAPIAKKPKIKVSKARRTGGRGRTGRVAKIKIPKAPRLKQIKVSVPKGRKVSFKQPTPTKARKSIKIKTG